jgi:hypothetical protein
MADPTDLHFRPADESQPEPLPEPPPPPSRLPLIAFALLVVLAGIAVYIIYGRRPPQESAVAEAPAVEEAKPLGDTPPPINLPPLEETDPIVRELVEKLSSHPRVLAWLTTQGLIRNFTTVVTNIAEGRTPAGLLRPLRPTGPYQVIERGETIQVDPRSYDRYNPIADAVSGIDPKAAAQLYATLKPRINDAYAEVAVAGTTFDGTLERALVRLIETPVPDAPPLLVPTGIVYGFEDPKLEDLSAAQKQLLRMGPRNARIVQAKLREIAIALGFSVR